MGCDGGGEGDAGARDGVSGAGGPGISGGSGCGEEGWDHVRYEGAAGSVVGSRGSGGGGGCEVWWWLVWRRWNEGLGAGGCGVVVVVVGVRIVVSVTEMVVDVGW